MLILEITKIKLTGVNIGFMLIVEMAKIESTGGHIKIMLFIEITKIKLTGGQVISITSIILMWPQLILFFHLYN